jgi:hypothetical protein
MENITEKDGLVEGSLWFDRLVDIVTALHRFVESGKGRDRARLNVRLKPRQETENPDRNCQETS